MYASIFSRFLCFLVPLLMVCVQTAAADEVDEAYAVAVGHYQSGRWKQAEEGLTAFLQSHPQHRGATEASLYLAEAQVQQGKYPQARAGFVEFLQREPKHRLAKHAAFRAAETAYLSGDYQTARPELEQFRQQYAEDELNAYVLSYLGEIALAARDHKRASSLYSAAIERFPNSSVSDESRFGLGRALEMQGDAEAARQAYGELAAGRGRLADDAQLQIGIGHYNQGQFEQAERAFQAAVSKFPDSELAANALYWLGLSRVARRSWDGAIEALEQAAVHYPQHALAPSIAFWLGEAYRQRGDTAAARDCYERLTADWPDSEWADDSLLSQVQLALDAGQHERVMSLAEGFFQRYSNSPLGPQARQLLGRSYLKQERFAEAADVFQALVRSTEEAAVARLVATQNSAVRRTNWYYLALAQLGSQDYEAALTSLESVQPLDQEKELQDGVRVARAMSFIGLKRYAEAIAPLKAYLVSSPQGQDAAQCRSQLVVTLARSDRLEEAIQTHEAMSDADRRHPSYLRSAEIVAETAIERGKYAEASAMYAALAGAGNPPETAARGWSGLGWTNFRVQKLDEARQAFAQVVKLYPQSPLAAEAAVMQAKALDQLGRAEEALTAYSVVTTNYGSSEHVATALFESARLLEQLGRKREAVSGLQRLTQDHPNFKQLDAALYQLAWLLVETGRPEEADTKFQELAQQHRASEYWADATYRLAERAAAAGQNDRAQELANEILQGQSPPELVSHALYLKGQMAGSASRWGEVVEPMQKLVEQFPESPLHTAAQYWIAEASFQQGQYEPAGERFAALSSAVTDGGEPWMAMVPLRQAQILLRQEKWQEAYDAAIKIDERFPGFRQQYEADYVVGRCLAMQAKFSEARERYERVTRSPAGGGTETAAMAEWMIGESYMHQKDYDKALKAFYRVETLFAYPRWQAAALLQAGKCHELKGESNEAIKLFTQVTTKHADTEFAKEASERLKKLENHGA